MPATPNILGERFGRLVVVSKTNERRSNGVLWLCHCDCGAKHKATTGSLRSRSVASCGCAKIDAGREQGRKSRTHGRTHSRPYRIWSKMKRRCLVPEDPAFKWYGGRGITVCDRWFKFENFLADMGEPPAGKTLERVDNDGPYCADNCIWASRKRQANNRRSNTRLTAYGRIQTLAQWAEEYSIKQATLRRRLYVRGMSLEAALIKPVRGYDKSMAELAQQAACSERAFYHRLQKGWPIEKALATPGRPKKTRKELR